MAKCGGNFEGFPKAMKDENVEDGLYRMYEISVGSRVARNWGESVFQSADSTNTRRIRCFYYIPFDLPTLNMGLCGNNNNIKLFPIHVGIQGMGRDDASIVATFGS